MNGEIINYGTITQHGQRKRAHVKYHPTPPAAQQAELQRIWDGLCRQSEREMRCVEKLQKAP